MEIFCPSRFRARNVPIVIFRRPLMVYQHRRIRRPKQDPGPERGFEYTLAWTSPTIGTMPRIHDNAIVLARHDFSETSQVVALLTRDHGKVRAMAKGIKRGTKTRFASGMDLLDIGHVVLIRRVERGEALSTLTEWKQTRSLPALRERLFRIHAAQYSADVTGRLTEEGDPHVALYDALVEALESLAVADEPFQIVARFQYALLDSIGSLPRFEACVHCDRREALTHFSSHEGGMICESCGPRQTEKHAVSNATCRVLSSGDLAAPAVPPRAPESENVPLPEAYPGPFRLLDYHISHLMGTESVMSAKLLSYGRT